MNLGPEDIPTLLLTCITSMATVIVVLWRYNNFKDKKMESLLSAHAQEYKEIAKENIRVQMNMIHSNNKVNESVERLTEAMKVNSDKVTDMMIRAIEEKK